MSDTRTLKFPAPLQPGESPLDAPHQQSLKEVPTAVTVALVNDSAVVPVPPDVGLVVTATSYMLPAPQMVITLKRVLFKSSSEVKDCLVTEETVTDDCTPAVSGDGDTVAVPLSPAAAYGPHAIVVTTCTIPS